eukprot:445990_1
MTQLQQQQIMIQNCKQNIAPIPHSINHNFNYYDECKNGINCKSYQYGNCIYYHRSNNNKEEVKQIINSINTNFQKTLNLSNGNILLYEKQIKINNTNMENINTNINTTNTRIQQKFEALTN